MSVSVTMPRLGESVSEGTITRWLKSEGDSVEADEPLLEVSTDKVDTEIPAPASGVLKSIKVAEDETVEVGAELAVIDEGGDGGGAAESDEDEQEPDDDAEPEPASESDEEAEEPEEEPEEPEEDEQPQPAAKQQEPKPDKDEPEPADEQGDEEDGGDGASYVTPLVRKLAAEHKVDLSKLKGSGVGGRIRKQDVLEAAKDGSAQEQAPAKREKPAEKERSAATAEPAARQPSRPSAQPTRGRTEKLSRLRKVIAERMTESLHISAQLTTVVEVDVSGIARLIDESGAEFEAREGVKLRFLPFFALAACEALKEHPAVNSSIDMDEGSVTYHDSIHLGVAVDTPRGLLVPVIHDAGDLNLGGLARKIADLATRTRDNQVTPDELGGGTFTLTNTGSRGVIIDTPIINQPQVGILGTGAVVKRPVVVDDENLGEVIAIRHMVYLCLTYDHRMIDGADAARFVTTMKRRLQDASSFEAELGK